MRWAVVTFPGSNCDRDCVWACSEVLGHEVATVWHADRELPPGVDCVVLPGGFSYGDYLRPGAIASLSPIMEAVSAFARQGGLVLGICNGFQVLVEAGLLPGALIRNTGLRFVCDWVWLRVEHEGSPLTGHTRGVHGPLRIPVAHNDGCYVVGTEELRRMEARGQVLLRYCDAQGRVVPEANPNGSVGNIAAVANEALNVFGMMPHPERAAHAALGSADGILLLESLASAAQRRGARQGEGVS